ncbi:MAG: acetylglutamate kinase [Chitinophagaceae bacterium]
MDKATIIKIGGNVVDDEALLQPFLDKFAALAGAKILIHGGGKLATRLAEQLNIPQQVLDGRRVTSADTLKIVTMVYAGYINKNIVALLQSRHCNALGVTGADGNCIRAHKRVVNEIDYGFAGDVDAVDAGFFRSLLLQDMVPVIAPLTHDGKGQLLNTNADTIAHQIAQALSTHFSTTLVYCFEREGVLNDTSDEDSVIKNITPETYKSLRSGNIIFAGMIPKLDAAFAAVSNGVARVVIGNGNKLDRLMEGKSGTSITNGS